MLQERRDIIRYAINLDILNINTYSGYKGDLIVKITTLDKNDDVKERLKAYAENLGMEVVVKNNIHVLVYEVYCISIDSDSYGLKLE